MIAGAFQRLAQPVNIHSATDLLWSSAEGALKQAAKEEQGKEIKIVASPNAPNAYAICTVLADFLTSKPAHHLHLRFPTDQCKTIFCKPQA